MAGRKGKQIDDGGKMTHEYLKYICLQKADQNYTTVHDDNREIGLQNFPLVPKNGKYFVVRAVNDTADIDGKTGELRTLRLALQQYEKKYKIIAKVITDDSEPVDIEIRWATPATDAILKQTGALAYAGYPKTIYQGKLIINDLLTWTLDNVYGKFRLIQTLIHELGHIFGLEHTEDDKDAMYPYYDKERLYLGDKSQATLKLLYGENEMVTSDPSRFKRWWDWIKARLQRRT